MSCNECVKSNKDKNFTKQIQEQEAHSLDGSIGTGFSTAEESYQQKFRLPDDGSGAYELKFYIKDNGSLESDSTRDDEWVDFSERCEVKGKNTLQSLGTITHSMEGEKPNTFHTNTQSLKLNNFDGFWDNPMAFELKTVNGNTAYFQETSGNENFCWYKQECKITRKIAYENFAKEDEIGHFLIETLKTDSDSGSATMGLVGLEKKLIEGNAESVKNGKTWYKNKSFEFLVKKLLFTEYKQIVNSEEILRDIDQVNVASFKEENEFPTFTDYGNPTEAPNEAVCVSMASRQLFKERITTDISKGDTVIYFSTITNMVHVKEGDYLTIGVINSDSSITREKLEVVADSEDDGTGKLKITIMAVNFDFIENGTNYIYATREIIYLGASKTDIDGDMELWVLDPDSFRYKKLIGTGESGHYATYTAYFGTLPTGLMMRKLWYYETDDIMYGVMLQKSPDTCIEVVNSVLFKITIDITKEWNDNAQLTYPPTHVEIFNSEVSTDYRMFPGNIQYRYGYKVVGESLVDHSTSKPTAISLNGAVSKGAHVLGQYTPYSPSIWINSAYNARYLIYGGASWYDCVSPAAVGQVILEWNKIYNTKISPSACNFCGGENVTIPATQKLFVSKSDGNGHLERQNRDSFLDNAPQVGTVNTDFTNLEKKHYTILSKVSNETSNSGALRKQINSSRLGSTHHGAIDKYKYIYDPINDIFTQKLYTDWTTDDLGMHLNQQGVATKELIYTPLLYDYVTIPIITPVIALYINNIIQGCFFPRYDNDDPSTPEPIKTYIENYDGVIIFNNNSVYGLELYQVHNARYLDIGGTGYVNVLTLPDANVISLLNWKTAMSNAFFNSYMKGPTCAYNSNIRWGYMHLANDFLDGEMKLEVVMSFGNHLKTNNINYGGLTPFPDQNIYNHDLGYNNNAQSGTINKAYCVRHGFVVSNSPGADYRSYIKIPCEATSSNDVKVAMGVNIVNGLEQISTVDIDLNYTQGYGTINATQMTDYYRMRLDYNYAYRSPIDFLMARCFYKNYISFTGLQVMSLGASSGNYYIIGVSTGGNNFIDEVISGAKLYNDSTGGTYIVIGCNTNPLQTYLGYATICVKWKSGITGFVVGNNLQFNIGIDENEGKPQPKLVLTGPLDKEEDDYYYCKVYAESYIEGSSYPNNYESFAEPTMSLIIRAGRDHSDYDFKIGHHLGSDLAISWNKDDNDAILFLMKQNDTASYLYRVVKYDFSSDALTTKRDYTTGIKYIRSVPYLTLVRAFDTYVYAYIWWVDNSVITVPTISATTASRSIIEEDGVVKWDPETDLTGVIYPQVPLPSTFNKFTAFLTSLDINSQYVLSYGVCSVFSKYSLVDDTKAWGIGSIFSSIINIYGVFIFPNLKIKEFKSDNSFIDGLFYYFIQGGETYNLYKWDQYNNIFTVCSQGSEPIDGDENNLSDIIFLDNWFNEIFGSSQRYFSELSILPDAFSSVSEKFHIWKLSTNFGGFVEIADFSELSVWEALTLIAEASNSVMGFDQNGGFFFIQRTSELDETDSILTIDDIENDNLIKIDKNLDYKKIYNSAEIISYIPVVDNPQVTVRPIDVFDNVRVSGYMKSGDEIVEQRGSYSERPEVVANQMNDERKTLILVCTETGEGIDGDDTGYTSKWKYKEISDVIDLRLVVAIGATLSTSIVVNEFPLNDDGSSMMKTGDTIYIGSDERTISSFAIDSRTITIDLGVADKVIGTSIIIISQDDNLFKAVGDGLSVSSGYTYTPHTYFLEVGEWYYGTYVKGSWFNEVGQRATVGGGGIESNQYNPTEDAVVYQVYRINGVITTALDFWSTNREGYRTIDYNDGGSLDQQEVDDANTGNHPSGLAFEKNRHRTFIELKFTFNSQRFKVGDIIEVIAQGLVLKRNESQNQVFTDYTSFTKYGKRQYVVDNRFVNINYARNLAMSIVNYFKNPQYEISATGLNNFDIKLRDVITVKHKKLFNSNSEYKAVIEINEISFDLTKNGTMEITGRTFKTYGF